MRDERDTRWFSPIGILLLVALPLGVATAMVVADVGGDRAHTVQILAPVPLLEVSRPLGYPNSPNRVIETLQPGAAVKVLRISYGKDYMAVRVQSETGATGSVISGPGIRVLGGE